MKNRIVSTLRTTAFIPLLLLGFQLSSGALGAQDPELNLPTVTAAPGEAACISTPADLVAWWSAEGDGGDSIGRHQASLSGGVTFASGKVGQGFQLNGSYGRVTVPDSADLNFGPGADLSIEGWIKVDPGTVKYAITIVDKRLAPAELDGIPYNAAVGYTLYLVGGSLGFQLADAPLENNRFHDFYSSSADLRDGQFHHVAVTVSRASQTGGNLYVDGQVVLTFDPTVVPGSLVNAEPFRIGNHASEGYDSFFPGTIDELGVYRRALGATEVRAIYEAGSAGKCLGGRLPPPPGLSAWWPAEGNARDAAGVAGEGKVFGVTYAAGVVGQAFQFQKSGDHIEIAPSPATDLGQYPGFTIEGWIKPSDLVAQHPIVEWNSGTAYGAHFYFSVIPPYGAGPGCLYANLVDSAGLDHWLTTEAGVVTLNEYQHVALTYDQTTGQAALYRNGTLLNQQALGSFVPQTTYPLLLGHRPPGFDGSPFTFAGGMDEVALYRRALNAREIRALYDAGSAGKCGVAGGSIAAWPFDETSGSQAHDRVGRFDGTLNAGAQFVPSGVSGNAVSLSRDQGGLVNMGNVLGLTDTTFTVAVWVKMNSGDVTENSLVLSKHEAGYNNGYFLVVNQSNSFIGRQNKAAFYAGNGGEAPTSITSVNDGQWHFLAAVHQQTGTNLLYVDGVLEGAAPSQPVDASPAPFLVGGASFGSSPTGEFTGQIDELQIYSRELNASEIQLLFGENPESPAKPLWVSTLAGSGVPAFQDGPPAMASFNSPNGGYVGADRAAYIADTQNHRIRRVDLASGKTTTHAGSGVAGNRNGLAETAEFNLPLGTFVDRFGSVFVADTGNNQIRKISTDSPRQVGRYAGSGTRGYLDGPADVAQFDFPNDLVVDPSGTMFVSEYNNHTVRKVTPGGMVTTFVGNGSPGFADDIGTRAGLNQPAGIAIDKEGNLFVTEWASHRIRKITPDARVTTLAGSVFPGFSDGAGETARFYWPDGIAIDGAGVLFVTDHGNHNIRRITPDGVVTTVAGQTVRGYQDGPALLAQFSGPGGIGIDPDGNLFIADSDNNRIRQIGILSSPTVTIEPFNRTVAVGAQVDLIAHTGGSGPFTFRWKFEGNVIIGATNPVLTLADVQLEQAGSYSVVASNPAESVESAPVQLVVLMPIQFLRSLPVYYSPGITFTVRLDPVEGPFLQGFAYAVEEFPPVGWAVGKISNGGTYDSSTHKVKFGPFLEWSKRVLTYELTPTEGNSGPQSFTGVTSSDGAELPVRGVDTISPAPLHPADLTPADRRISVNEVTAYAAAWRKGQAWAVEPNPIPIEYVTRAGLLWKNGERYRFDPDAPRAPLWWVNATNISVAGLKGSNRAFLTAPTNLATRTLPGAVVASEAFEIRIVIEPANGVLAYAVEEHLGDGLVAVEISDDGQVDPQSRIVRWGPFFDSVKRELRVSVLLNTADATSARFTGLASFDGVNLEIGGPQEVAAGVRLGSPSKLPNGEIKMTVGLPDGRQLVIEASPDLQWWVPLMRVSVENGALLFREPVLASPPQRFYRAVNPGP